jgi:hypothetical protein
MELPNLRYVDHSAQSDRVLWFSDIQVSKRRQFREDANYTFVDTTKALTKRYQAVKALTITNFCTGCAQVQ